MTLPCSALAPRLCLCLAALLCPMLNAGQPASFPYGSALAQSADASEKEAFDAAKDLGTVDAWNAFLSTYPTGFRADLARAYIKKISNEPQAPTAAPAPAAPTAASRTDWPAPDFPATAGSWGGVVRDGPGQQHRQIGSLDEGDPVTLLGRAEEIDNGFPWFKIAYKDGNGYQWGGILCSTAAARSDLFQTCPAAWASRNGSESGKEPRCREGGEWDGLRCRPAGYFDKGKKKRCRGNATFIEETGRCVDLEAQEDAGGGELNNPPKRKKCRAGNYLNQNGVCQPNETGQ